MSRPHLIMVAVAVIWASTYSVGRQATGHAGPHAVAFMRFAIASAALVPLLWRRQGHLCIERRQWPLVFALAFTSVLSYNLFFFSSVQRIPASRVALIVALNPIVVALANVLVLRSPMRPWQAAGVLLGLLGVLLVISRGDFAALDRGLGRGELLALGCTVAWSAYTLQARRIPASGLSSLAATTWASIAGALMLAVPALLEGDLVRVREYPAATWVAAAYLGIVATALAFVWYADSVATLGVTRAVVFTNLVPVLAVAIGVTLLGEPLHWSVLVGGALATAGVALTNANDSLSARARVFRSGN